MASLSPAPLHSDVDESKSPVRCPASRSRVDECSQCTVLLSSSLHEGDGPHLFCLRVEPNRPCYMLIKHDSTTTVSDIHTNLVLRPLSTSSAISSTELAHSTTPRHCCSHARVSINKHIHFPAPDNDTPLRTIPLHEGFGGAQTCYATVSRLSVEDCQQWLRQLGSGTGVEQQLPRAFLRVSYKLTKRVASDALSAEDVERYIGVRKRSNAAAKAKKRERERQCRDEHDEHRSVATSIAEVYRDPTAVLLRRGEDHKNDPLLSDAFLQETKDWWYSRMVEPLIPAEVRQEAERCMARASVWRRRAATAIGENPRCLPSFPWHYPSDGLSFALIPFIRETTIVNLHPHKVAFRTGGGCWFSNTNDCWTEYGHAETINRLRFDWPCTTQWRCEHAGCPQRGEHHLRMGATYVLKDEWGATLVEIDSAALGYRKPIHNPVRAVQVDWSKSGLCGSVPIRSSI